VSIDRIRVQMLGRFSIEVGAREIDDSGDRSHKVWLLLAYMIYDRDRAVTQEDLIRLLWGEESSSNPLNALERRLESCLRAVELYQGDFLVKLATEPWVVPIAAYFHNRYIQVVRESLPLLETRGRRQEAVALCRRALEVEPYDEGLYRHRMRNLLDLGCQKEAIAVYEDMSELLFTNFGVMPSEEIRALYREAVRTVNDRAVPMGVVREQLREPNSASGALFCEYDFFKVLYHAEARAIARSGDAVHIALLSVLGEGGEELPKRSLDRVMENLREVIRHNLRRADVVTRCSVSQYLLMLPQANYENSGMVCERVIKAFFRQYPHSPASLNYSVQPLELSV